MNGPIWSKPTKEKCVRFWLRIWKRERRKERGRESKIVIKRASLPKWPPPLDSLLSASNEKKTIFLAFSQVHILNIFRFDVFGLRWFRFICLFFSMFFFLVCFSFTSTVEISLSDAFSIRFGSFFLSSSTIFGCVKYLLSLVVIPVAAYVCVCVLRCRCGKRTEEKIGPN